MPVEPSDEEENYFKALEMEQRKQIRERLDRSARELQAVASGLDTKDLSIAERVRALGFDGDSARVFDLLPLVHVAWADGEIQRSERAKILRILESRDIHPGSEAFRMVETLLEERPSDAYMQQSLAVLGDVLGGLGQRSEAIVDMCIDVAAASGGFLGLGKRIGAEERELIEGIVGTLGDTAQSQFKTSLGDKQS
jgi:tellurite resistance protein